MSDPRCEGRINSTGEYCTHGAVFRYRYGDSDRVEWLCAKHYKKQTRAGHALTLVESLDPGRPVAVR